MWLPTFPLLLAVLIIIIRPALSLPQPEQTNSQPTKRQDEAFNSLAALLGLSALSMAPFLLAPHPDACFMEALRTREMQRAAAGESSRRLDRERARARYEPTHRVPTGRSTLQELAEYCRALHRYVPGRSDPIDLSGAVYRPILARGLSQCVKQECKPLEEAHRGACKEECVRLWSVEAPPWYETGHEWDTGDPVEMVVERVQREAGRVAGRVGAVINAGLKGAKDSKALGGTFGRIPAVPVFGH